MWARGGGGFTHYSLKLSPSPGGLFWRNPFIRWSVAAAVGEFAAEEMYKLLFVCVYITDTPEYSKYLQHADLKIFRQYMRGGGVGGNVTIIFISLGLRRILCR